MDYYAILGVEKNATSAEIKKAYKKLAMQHHPDKGGDNAKFQSINEAYSVLGDEHKRSEYDRPSPSFNNPFNFNDIFTQHNPFGQSMAKQVYRTRVVISLLDAYLCTDKVMQIQTQQETKVITIKIPKGVQSGDKIRYDTVIEGSILLVEFVISPDLRFDKKGHDLYSNIPVSVLDLVIGTKIQFVTVDGKTLEINIRAGTQPNAQLKIANGGMPKPNGDYGNQILCIKPFIPDNISSEIIETIKKHQNKQG